MLSCVLCMKEEYSDHEREETLGRLERLRDLFPENSDLAQLALNFMAGIPLYSVEVKGARLECSVDDGVIAVREKLERFLCALEPLAAAKEAELSEMAELKRQLEVAVLENEGLKLQVKDLQKRHDGLAWENASLRGEIEQLRGAARGNVATGAASAIPKPAGLPKGRVLIPGEVPEGRVSFIDAAEMLEGELDLWAAFDEAVKAHQRWGYIDALVRMGKLQNDMDYGGRFEQATIGKDDLRRLLNALRNGHPYLPIFDIGELHPQEVWHFLFHEAGIPNNRSKNRPLHKDRRTKNIRKIIPEDFGSIGFDLRQLHALSEEEQQRAFTTVYHQNGVFLRPTGARVLFTPDFGNTVAGDLSAVNDLQRLSDEPSHCQILDLSANLIRFRTQMDKGLKLIATQRRKYSFDQFDPESYNRFMLECLLDGSLDEHMPDSTVITRVSDAVFPDGRVVALSWNAQQRYVCLDTYSPHDSQSNLGSRRVLG